MNIGEAHPASSPVARLPIWKERTPPALNRFSLPACGLRFQMGSGPVISFLTSHKTPSVWRTEISIDLSWSSEQMELRVAPETKESTILGLAPSARRMG